MEYAAATYGGAASAGLFAAACAAMLGAFLAQHCWLLARGVTSNEAAKAQDLAAAQRRAWAQQLGADGSSGGWRGALGRAAAALGLQRRGAGAGTAPPPALPRAQPYDRGSVAANAWEVLAPGAFLRARVVAATAVAAAAAAAGEEDKDEPAEEAAAAARPRQARGAAAGDTAAGAGAEPGAPRRRPQRARARAAGPD
jgi:hypothetical protein